MTPASSVKQYLHYLQDDPVRPELAKDPGESKNLAVQDPDRVKELSDLLRRIRADGRSRP